MTDTARLRADWLTIWRSEAMALAADREMAEAQIRLLDAALSDRALGEHALGEHAPGERAAVPAVSRPAAPAGPTAAGAAPAARGWDGVTLAELRTRLEQLERRLDAARR